MNSKINGVGGNTPRIDSGKPANGVRPGARVEGPAAPGRGDEVSLTGSAQLMVRLEKALGEVPVIDRERVETIKAAIADGSYAIDPERVATEVLRMEMDLKLLR